MLILPAAMTLADSHGEVESLQLKLLMRDSATLVLDDWCRDHRLAPVGSKIVAERDRSVEKPAPADVRAALQVGRDESVRYRRVRLKCGELVLSEADNWYVPARLTPAMNETLDTTDTSFGRVVRPLGFTRRTLASRLMRGGRTVIENRGLLVLPDGRPISLVVENYTRAVLHR